MKCPPTSPFLSPLAELAIEVRFASDQSYDYHDDDDYDDALHGYGDNTLDDGVGAEGSEPDYEDDFFGDDDF